MAPIGIFGGTFDPIHYGHLRLAQEIAESMRMAEVRFVPSATPPHRAAPQVTSQQRLEMVRLATAGNPLFTVDDREFRRSGPGYTIDTLTELRREAGAMRPLCLLLGADAFLELATWHRWHELFGLAHLIVAHRPGFPPESWPARMPQPLAREYQARLLHQPFAVHLSPAGGIATQAIAALDISGSMIRDSLTRGVSPRYLLPDPVLDYIRNHNLYVTQEVNESR
ncbi:MAG: nicotinate-nucleotide adenylyltransferase [Betaproteobacteria bacterium]|nr:nicotinate-nucleotide adenylyltransferase [Betaproteobacteria bacterium]